jgi:RNA polymerase sigma-70 factor (ECF subfamily)
MMAEDITEEVFIKAWKAMKSCRGRASTFSSWIYRIAHNHVINCVRDNNRTVTMAMESLVGISDRRQVVDRTLDGYDLAEMLDYLPGNQKQVIILKFVVGMDNKDISRIMNKSEVAIRILQMRALSELRKQIGGGVNINGT